jgi:hypothetical protein
LFGAAQVPVSPENISKRTTKPETKDISKKKPETIKAFDYHSWDKFDVVNKILYIYVVLSMSFFKTNYFLTII